MVLKLYKADFSGPARAAMMTCELLGVPVEYVDVNLMTRENFTPEYVKKNPMHTVPVFEDGDFVICDSNAIMIYLAETYGKQESFYPKDAKSRALVHQQLFMNSTALFSRAYAVSYPYFTEGIITVPVKRLEAIEEAYGFLEEFLNRTKFVAGNNLTVADIAAYSSVSSMDVIKPIDAKKFPKLTTWLKHIEQQPYAQKKNASGVQLYKKLLEKLLANLPK